MEDGQGPPRAPTRHSAERRKPGHNPTFRTPAQFHRKQSRGSGRQSRHPPSLRPVVGHCGIGPMRDSARSNWPSRHRSTSSINASLGNPIGPRHARRGAGAFRPPLGTRRELVDARETSAPGATGASRRPLTTPLSLGPGTSSRATLPVMTRRAVGFTILILPALNCPKRISHE